MTIMEWVDNFKDTPSEATLYALTVSNLRHINTHDNQLYWQIYSFLYDHGKEINPDYSSKILSIFEQCNEYDKKLIGNLNKIERNIIKKSKFSNNKKCNVENKKCNVENKKCVENKTMTSKINKWWE